MINVSLINENKGEHRGKSKIAFTHSANHCSTELEVGTYQGCGSRCCGVGVIFRSVGAGSASKLPLGSR